MTIWFNRKGFTLVEIMIVVAIIGLLAAIAIPNYSKARQAALKNVCISNLRQIQGAVQIWAIDKGKNSADTFDTGDIVPNYLKSWPSEGRTPYPVPGSVADTPVCPNSSANTDSPVFRIRPKLEQRCFLLGKLAPPDGFGKCECKHLHIDWRSMLVDKLNDITRH